MILPSSVVPSFRCSVSARTQTVQTARQTTMTRRFFKRIRITPPVKVKKRCGRDPENTSGYSRFVAYLQQVELTTAREEWGGERGSPSTTHAARRTPRTSSFRGTPRNLGELIQNSAPFDGSPLGGRASRQAAARREPRPPEAATAC